MLVAIIQKHIQVWNWFIISIIKLGKSECLNALELTYFAQIPDKLYVRAIILRCARNGESDLIFGVLCFANRLLYNNDLAKFQVFVSKHSSSFILSLFDDDICSKIQNMSILIENFIVKSTFVIASILIH